MQLARLAKSILPAGAFDSLRRAKRDRERRRITAQPALNEENFRDILERDLELSSGDVVYVHSGIDRLHLAFPFYRILSLLRDVVGSNGTVVFPTYPNQNISSYEYLKRGSTFDVRRTPSYTGILTEFARRQKNARRSLHPTKSVCAIGPGAEDLVATHHQSPYPYDKCSPYYKLIACKAKIVGLGVSTNYLSFGYTIDDAMKDEFPVRVYHDKLFNVPCINYEGEKVIVSTYAHDMDQVIHVDMPRFMKRNVSAEACRDLTISEMKFFRANAPKLFEEMLKLAESGITTYPKSVWK